MKLVFANVETKDVLWSFVYEKIVPIIPVAKDIVQYRHTSDDNQEEARDSKTLEHFRNIDRKCWKVVYVHHEYTEIELGANIQHVAYVFVEPVIKS